MKRLQELLANERGNVTLPLIILAAGLFLVVGLVIDGAGKIQAGEQAHQIAAAAARSAANSITGDAVLAGGVGLNTVHAQAVAQQSIAASGAEGSVSVSGNTITATVRVDYTTIFLSALGFSTLTGEASASARLIDG